ncbi:MAG: glycosyltransferase [Acutalibacteraceae bacterium]|nr:glycosyltransferase [Acutalibacteraceae bacterium]
MKENPLISVIVPIYKVEDYLKRCVDSIINQTYNNLEIILVDDGSPDNCPQICDNYAKQDSRIKVVHKKNGGLSDARNAGMKVATGEYISFIDSDDWIDLNTYMLTVEKMIETNSDIGAFNIILVYDDKEISPDLSQEFEVMNSEQAIETTIDNIKVRTPVWNKIYKKDLLKDLEFKKGKLNEDEFFTFRVLDKANKIVYLHRQNYYYYQRATSIMGKYSVKRLDMVEGVRERLLFISENYPGLYNKAKISFCFTCLYHYQKLLKNANIDSDNIGKRKLKEYRKQIHIGIKDVQERNFLDKVSLLVSNCEFGLELIARLRNILNYGI